MTFTWVGNVGHLSDEDIIAIAEDMRAKGLDLTQLDVVKHLGRIDPEGTLNISSQGFLKRAKGLEI